VTESSLEEVNTAGSYATRHWFVERLFPQVIFTLCLFKMFYFLQIIKINVENFIYYRVIN